jgi:hypothetical protein
MSGDEGGSSVRAGSVTVVTVLSVGTIFLGLPFSMHALELTHRLWRRRVAESHMVVIDTRRRDLSQGIVAAYGTWGRTTVRIDQVLE